MGARRSVTVPGTRSGSAASLSGAAACRATVRSLGRRHARSAGSWGCPMWSEGGLPAGAEQDGGAGGEREVETGGEAGRCGRWEPVLVGGVDDDVIPAGPWFARESEDGVVPSGVQDQQVGLVQQALATGAALADATAVEVHADRVGGGGKPVGVGHFGAVGAK